MRRYRGRRSARPGKTRGPAAGRTSFPVNFNVPAEAGKLNSNKICAVRIHGRTMRWLNSYFGDRRHGVVTVVDYTLSAGTELNDLCKRILRTPQRIRELKIRVWGGNIWAGSIAYFRGSGRDGGSRVESLGGRRTRASGECF